jgi:hypothetical protein
VHLSPTGFDSATWLAALIKNHPFERCTPDAALTNVHQNQNQNSEAASSRDDAAELGQATMTIDIRIASKGVIEALRDRIEELEESEAGGLPTVYQGLFSVAREGLKVVPVFNMAQATLRRRSAIPRLWSPIISNIFSTAASIS